MTTLWGRQVDGKEKTLSWVTARFWLIRDMESLSQGTLRTEESRRIDYPRETSGDECGLED